MPKSEIASVLAESNEGLDLITDEDAQEFLRRLASSHYAILRLDEPEGFPFWEARQSVTSEAAYSQWGVSIGVVQEIIEVFLAHATRVYEDEYRAVVDDEDDIEDLV